MATKKILKKFNVFVWDFNKDMIQTYDVLPYFRECLAERKKRNKAKLVQRLIKENSEFADHYIFPTTLDEMKRAITSDSMYMFWSRCEYEMICHGWPKRKNDYKLDVHEQVMANIDLIADILLKEITK